MAKICLINSLYRPYHRGGAEAVVERVVKGLVALDHQVVLITLGKNKSKHQASNLTVYRIKPFNVFSFFNIDKRPVWLRLIWHPLDVFNISGARQIKNILEQEKVDVVMTHNLKGIGYLVPRTIRKLGLRHIHTLHDVQLSRPSGLIFYGQEKPFLVLDKIYEKICRWFFASPDVVISPSKWLLDYYRKRGFFAESEKVVLPNPVIFRKIDKKAETHTDSRITLLYVGQLAWSKGIELLISACKKLEGQNWRLLIAGSGQAQDKVKQMIAGDNHFEFVGWIDPESLPQLYRQVDLTIVPSLVYENSPAVIYESLVANVPVIASDIGGISEIVKDEHNGYTFVPGDEKNLREVLQYFLIHPEKIGELRKNAFVSVREFSLNNYLKKLLSFLNT